MIKLTLPIPISVNQAYAWKARRFKSKSYKEWEQLATIEYNEQGNNWSIDWDEWLEINCRFYTNIYNKNWTKKIKDVDNYFKALLDWLANNIKGFKDHKLKRIIWEKFESKRSEVEIEIKEI